MNDPRNLQRQLMNDLWYDDIHYLDPLQVLAETNDRKTAPADRTSRVEKPMFYDLGQKTLGYEELRGWIIPTSNTFNVACNYAYALFGVASLKLAGSTNGGRSRYYKCACCTLRIRFDQKTNVVREDDFFVLHAESFPRRLLNRSNGGKSPHRELCNPPESKVITKTFMVLNHPFFLVCFQAFLPLNSLMVVHLKTKKIVQSIKLMFEQGNNSPNKVPLSPTSWNNIIDNMIDILHKKFAREYKTLPKNSLI